MISNFVPLASVNCVLTRTTDKISITYTYENVVLEVHKFSRLEPTDWMCFVKHSSDPIYYILYW